MKKYITLSIVALIFSLSCERNDIISKIKDNDNHAINLTISPLNSVVYTGVTVQYAATATFEDSTTEDVTSSATWNIAGNALAGVTPGSVISGSPGGTATISASYDSLNSVNATLIVRDEIYVSASSGNDVSGDGSSANPYATIGYAVTQAGSLPADIYIASGNYLHASALNLTVDGVSIYGGYDNSFNYNPIPANIANIYDNGTSGSAITCSSTITSSTVISYLNIYGSTAGTAATAAAINTAGSPTISNCTITGGYANSTGTSYGILSSASSGTTIITNSSLNGGTGQMYSYGIYATSNLEINNSNINGGSTTVNTGSSNGIYLTSTASVITNAGTTIVGGSSTGTNSFTYGVYNSSSSPNFFHDTNINGGSASATGGVCYGIYSNGTGAFYIDSGTIIYGGDGIAYSYGIYISSSSSAGILSLNNASVNGGTSTTYSYGIYSADTGPSIIEFSNIHGGSALYTYAYMQPTVSTSTLVIRSSTISGGDGSVISRGITLNNNANPSPYIYNNIITCGSNVSGSTTSTGIALGQGSSPIISNNTISTGNSNVNAYGINTAYGARPYIYNNIFLTPSTLGSRYGIYEGYSGADPMEVMNNIFWETTTIYHNYVDGGAGDNNWSTIATTESGLIAEGSTAASGNINQDPMLVSINDYHIDNASSPAISAGLNGTDEGWLYFPLNTSSNAIDLDGVERPFSPSPWSIGAYEY